MTKSLNDILMERLGGEMALGERSNLSASMRKVLKRRGVARTADFRRIEALPRRNAACSDEFIDNLTYHLKTSEGTERLFAIQAAALREIHDYEGAFLPIAVGGGKSYISLLAPELIDRVKRPVLFVPASLRDQTKKFVIPKMRKHWRREKKVRVLSYTALSLEKNDTLLEKMNPDMIILDECHMVRSRLAGRTKRLARYLKERPDTIVVAMSGTISSRSLKDYHHIIRWCLGEERSPLPKKWMELCDWAAAVDEGVPPQKRLGPGAIKHHFCLPDENVRQGYRRRLVETPGVVASGAEELGVSLVIDRRDCKLTDATLSLIDDVRNTWEDPNGGSIAEAIDLWRIIRQLSQGFWYQWQPAAPKKWLEARRAWKRYVRHTLTHNRRKLDTELQVWNECKEKPTPEWLAWVAIKDSFVPNPVPVWVDDSLVHNVSNWAKDGPGIVWVENTAVGERLQEKLGIPYFGAGKKASREILSAEGVIAASINAHGQGKNLQQWSRNLVVSTPGSGKTYEQLLGRTHRHGQLEDTVFFWVLLHQPELVAGFSQALRDAVYLEDSLGIRQRLNYANILFKGELT